MKIWIFSAAMIAVLAPATSSLHAEEKRTLIFEDDFERTESQEERDEVGNGWTTNSKSRAKGHKQVDLKEGEMRVTTHAEADHAASVNHPLEFRDGDVELRFMLEDPADRLGLNFADMQLKEVHAGHLFTARVGAKAVELLDLKTGGMVREVRERRVANRLTDEDKARIKATTKRVPVELKPGQWYSLKVSVRGDTLSVSIDGREVGSFTSEGFAHPTKRMLRLDVPKSAVIDDVKIYAVSGA